MIQQEPNAVELIRQGEQKLVNEEWLEALADFDNALNLLLSEKEAPAAHLAEAHNGRGAALLQMNLYPDAIKALQAALKYQPDLAGAYFNLGLAYENMEVFEAAEAERNSQKAIEAYNKAIELEPNDAEFYFRRGGAYFAREEFAKTVEDASRAIELHSEGPLVAPYIARGLAYFQLEQYPKAIADFSEAMKADPRAAADAFFYRALVYINANDALSARADLQAFLIVTDDPDSNMSQQAKEIIEELDKQ